MTDNYTDLARCMGHDHGPRHKCFVSVPMTVEELADAILKGDYP